MCYFKVTDTIGTIKNRHVKGKRKQAVEQASGKVQSFLAEGGMSMTIIELFNPVTGRVDQSQFQGSGTFAWLEGYVVELAFF